MDPTSSLNELVQQSQYRETVMLVCLVLFSVGYLLKLIIPLFKSKGSEKAFADRELEEARVQSIRVITTKDVDGNYIILSFPRQMRELIGEMRTIGTQITHLVNHQSEMMERLHNQDDEILKRLDHIERKK